MEKNLTQKERFEIKKKLESIYQKGTKVELVKMNDIYTSIPVGTKGVVSHIDDTATIFVSWKNGSSLGVVYGEYKLKPIFCEIKT